MPLLPKMCARAVIGSSPSARSLSYILRLAQPHPQADRQDKNQKQEPSQNEQYRPPTPPEIPLMRRHDRVHPRSYSAHLYLAERKRVRLSRCGSALWFLPVQHVRFGSLGPSFVTRLWRRWRREVLLARSRHGCSGVALWTRPLGLFYWAGV